MAGERFSVPGWTEVSAVCTDPAFRGQGLATRLIRAVAARVRALYERIGFTRLATVVVAGLAPRS